MKKLLPKSFNNPHGFTLVELLVVIAIIAILSTIGVVLYGNVQVRGRDARRTGDIDSIGTAMEVAKGSATTYPALTGSLFASGVVPTDPTTGTGARNYCYVTATTVAGLAANPTNWTSGCPGGWTAITSAGGMPTAAAWKVCASLEQTTSTPNVVCSTNQQ